MLSAQIKIQNIGYEDTFCQLFPVIKDKVSAMEDNQPFIRLFHKLDDAALPVLLGIMSKLDKEAKDDLLVICLNSYAPKLIEKLNEQFANHPLGKNLNIESLSVAKDENCILWLRLDHITINYSGLLDQEQIQQKMEQKLGSLAGWAKLAGKAAAFVTPEFAEEKALSLLWKEESKRVLLALMQSTIDQHGLVLELVDLYLEQDKQSDSDIVEIPTDFRMTVELEDNLITALAEYLKLLVSDAG